MMGDGVLELLMTQKPIDFFGRLAGQPQMTGHEADRKGIKCVTAAIDPREVCKTVDERQRVHTNTKSD